MRQIAELYAIEKTVCGSAPRAFSAPIIAASHPWLAVQLPRFPRSSKLTEDIRYTLAHWSGLSQFLEDGRLELDTNPVENQIRKIALTRKKIQRGVHRSVRQLQSDIKAFTDAHNKDPKPYRWFKSADDILASVKRFCQKVDATLYDELWVHKTSAKAHFTSNILFSGNQTVHKLKSHIENTNQYL